MSTCTCQTVTGLVQDAIFSRPPDAGVDTGIFIAGKDVSLALDMFDAAKKAMVPPFKISVFADPAGSFTTAAAMVAKVEKALEKKFQRDLKDTKVSRLRRDRRGRFLHGCHRGQGRREGHACRA